MRRAVVGVLISSLMAGPVWAEQVVLDGQEFRAHVERDRRVQADRDNLEQQVGLYRQNEAYYKKAIAAQKALQQKTEEKSSAQESLIQTYEAQRVQLLRERQEFADEARGELCGGGDRDGCGGGLSAARRVVMLHQFLFVLGVLVAVFGLVVSLPGVFVFCLGWILILFALDEIL